MKNWSVINPEVDEVLAQGPVWLYSLFAALAIAMGAVFAFFGLKTIRIQSTIYGAFLCGLFASFILYLIPGQESGAVWLGSVIPTAVIGGYILGRVLILRKAVLFLAVAFAIAGVINQYFVAYLSEAPSWIIYSIMALSLIVCSLFIWRYFNLSAILATAFLGGFLVLLGTAYFLREQISLIGMWVDPEFLQSCPDVICWLPFIVGGSVFVFGSLFQICMRKCKTDVKQLDEDADPDDPTPSTPMVSPDRNERNPPSRAAISPEWETRTPPSRLSWSGSRNRSTPRSFSINPFSPEHGNDPLIIELTETLESRKSRSTRRDMAYT